MTDAVMLVALALGPLWAQPMTPGERDFALSSLHASRKALLDSITGLSEAQWKFKPAPGRWSVEEVTEHVILSEDFVFGRLQQALESPPAARREVRREPELGLLERLRDRSQRSRNNAQTEPSGRFPTPAAAAEAFRQRRERTLDFVRTTREDLRVHVSNPGQNALDAYQMLILLAGHTDRHVAQINEVKGDPRFPR